MDAIAQGERLFGIRTARKFSRQLDAQIMLLTANPYIGKIEPLLEGRKTSFRSLVVHKHFKLIYYLNDSQQTLYIAALWDTRREPSVQARSTRKE